MFWLLYQLGVKYRARFFSRADAMTQQQYLEINPSSLVRRSITHIIECEKMAEAPKILARCEEDSWSRVECGSTRDLVPLTLERAQSHWVEHKSSSLTSSQDELARYRLVYFSCFPLKRPQNDWISLKIWKNIKTVMTKTLKQQSTDLVLEIKYFCDRGLLGSASRVKIMKMTNSVIFNCCTEKEGLSDLLHM